MQRKIVWISGVVFVLVFLSGFILCPHMRLFSPPEGVQQSQVDERLAPLAVRSVHSKPAVKESQSKQQHFKHGAPKALAVMTDEQLKASNYRSYIYRTYAMQRSPQAAVLPSKKDSEQWIANEFAPALLEKLQEKRES